MLASTLRLHRECTEEISPSLIHYVDGIRFVPAAGRQLPLAVPRLIIHEVFVVDLAPQLVCHFFAFRFSFVALAIKFVNSSQMPKLLCKPLVYTHTM